MFHIGDMDRTLQTCVFLTPLGGLL